MTLQVFSLHNILDEVACMQCSTNVNAWKGFEMEIECAEILAAIKIKDTERFVHFLQIIGHQLRNSCLSKIQWALFLLPSAIE